VPCNSINLLYVDDEPILLDLVKEFLERGNMFEVDIAQSAVEALDILKKGDYEGVISDYQMPEMDGIEFLKSIRSRYPDLPFILFTGKGREEVVIQAIDAGADYYVQKGGEIRSQFRELSHKIKLAVDKRHVEKELKASEERYRNVVEDQTEFICRFKPDGTHNFVNEAYCQCFGRQKEKIIGQRFIPKIPKEDRELIRLHFASLTRDNPGGTVEHRLILPDGSVRWHQWCDRAIFDEYGTLIEYQSVGHDITHRKTAELDRIKLNDELHAAYEQLAATEEELRSGYEDLVESQRSLEDKEITLNAVLSESPIAQFVIDRDHKILYWNHALAAQSRIMADDVSGTDQHWRAFYTSKRPCLADFLVDESYDKIPEWYADKCDKFALIDNAYEVTDFFPQMGKEGKWLHFTAGLIKNRNGNVIGAVESLEDITDKKTAELELIKMNDELHAAYEQLAATEEELRSSYKDLVKSQHALQQSEDWYRNVVEDQTEFICRFRPDGTHVFVNDAYCRYFNKKREEILGYNFQPELFLEDRKHVQEIFASLTPENPVGFIRQRVIFPDGSIRWQRWVDRAIYDESGTLVEYQSVGRDITDVKDVELALAESEQRYRNIVEGQTEFICRFKPDGTHNFVNDAYCRYFGISREDIIGLRFIPKIPEEDRELLRSHFASLTCEHPVGTIEHRIIMPDGAVRWHQWNDRAIFNESGVLAEYQSVGRDITEWKTVELDLRKKNYELRNAYEQRSARQEEFQKQL
jgi:PAS domain S-box-containing protein